MSASRLIVSLEDSADARISAVGGKAQVLGLLARAGIPVCGGLVITTDAYRRFADANGLGEVAATEMERRARVRARAEEYWDSAQRIRGSFVRGAWPDRLDTEILDSLGSFNRAKWVVRASAAHPIAEQRGFTRMYDSFTDVSGEELLRAITWVWASLFSDRALLYSAELGLDPRSSVMAVLLQQQFSSEAAGCVLTASADPGQILVDAVAGPAARLADGQREPHRWVVDGPTARVLEHSLPDDGRSSDAPTQPPISDAQVEEVVSYAMIAERELDAPQACEFAIVGGRVLITESRTIAEAPADGRRDYLAVRLPESRLEKRRERIESEYLPAMWSEANALSVVDLSSLSDTDLASEASRRAEAVAHWRMVYRTVLAPFAHGQRLFGEYYVRMIAPQDPFEFISLLVRTPDEYMQRRQVLAELGIEPPDPPRTQQDRDAAEKALFAALPQEERAHAAWLLELARASWRMRDDDNLYLDRICSEAERVHDEMLRRLEGAPGDARSVSGPASREQLRASASALESLGGLSGSHEDDPASVEIAEHPDVLQGDPAAPGAARGPARVARTLDEARQLRPGEVLVVDELPPEAAAAATRAVAIIEARGGMFAHGAVLSREFGIPCVTAIAGATRLVRDGEIIAVDGGTGTLTFERP